MNLLTPAYLGFLSLLIPVVLLYFIKPKRKRIVVPSFHIWERMARAQQANDWLKKIKRLISLLLHCLLVLLLAFALARPFFSERLTPQRIVVILDASTSMLALAPDEAGQLDPDHRRFDDARAFARKLAGDLSPEDRLMIIEAASQPRVVLPLTSDRSRINDLLDTMSARPAQTNLQEAMSLAQAVARQLAAKAKKAREQRKDAWIGGFFKANTEEAETVIYVLSDGTDSQLSPESKGKNETEATPALTLPNRAKLFYVPFGTSSNPNVGLTAFAVRELLNSPGDHEVLATAHNYSEQELTIRPELFFEEGPEAEEDILDSMPQLAIGPGQSIPLPISETNIQRSGILKLRLTVTKVNGKPIQESGWRDLLSTDDVAYAVVPKVHFKKVLLIAANRNLFLETALAEDTSIQAERLLASDYATLPAAEKAKYDVIIFDQFLPEKLPPNQLMFFATRGPQSPLEGEGITSVPMVKDYHRNHPVMRYVQMENVNFLKSQKIIPSADRRWRVLVSSYRGPLLLAGDFPDRRMIYSAFHAIDTDMVLRKSWPIFVSNSVEWLSSRRRKKTEIPSFRTGFAAELSMPGVPERRLAIWPPGGKEVTPIPVPIYNGKATFTRTEAIGVYHAAAIPAAETEFLKQTKAPADARRFTVNLLSKTEGQIQVRKALGLGEKSVKYYEAGFEMEIRSSLILAILAVLLLESLFFHFLTVF
jgi:Ca-activated chloride channel homolog